MFSLMGFDVFDRGFGPIPPRGFPGSADDWGVVAMVLSHICPSPAVGALFNRWVEAMLVWRGKLVPVQTLLR